MKLNYRRTLLIGFAFFLISAFWQAYDSIIPKILTDKFGMAQAGSGIIMALDNVLALFMLPLFGALSDKCRSRLGKRTPFILLGTIVSAVLLVVLTATDAMQLKNLSAVKDLDSPAALETLYDFEYDGPLMTPEGEKYVLSEEEQAGMLSISRERFTGMTLERDGETNPDYINYVTPARQAYARAQTRAHPMAPVSYTHLRAHET